MKPFTIFISFLVILKRQSHLFSATSFSLPYNHNNLADLLGGRAHKNNFRLDYRALIFSPTVSIGISRDNVKPGLKKQCRLRLNLHPPLPDSNFGISDEEFRVLLHNEVETVPGRQEYSFVFDKSIDAMVQWRKRYRGNPKLWKRIFKMDRVVKELIEAAPIIHDVMTYVSSYDSEENEEKITIMDLCSGKGYLSMFLSELLPPEKIDKIILVDKAWAMCNTKELQPHHMNWDHIYGARPSLIMDADDDDTICEENQLPHENERSETYFTTWPVPLHTSKQDLKQSCNQRQMKKIFFDKIKGPVIILAIHLCGTLSLKAIDMFNNNDNVSFFALKPCCLPTMVYAQRGDIFKIGKHEFHAEDVCSLGSFNKKNWNGPPRRQLEQKFNVWADNLYKGIDVSSFHVSDDDNGDNAEIDSSFITDENGRKVKQNIVVQVDGGYQNTYIFAERSPLTNDLWTTKKNTFQ